MSPSFVLSSTGVSSFPRVSGDEPRALSKVFIKDKFSPRERG